MLMIQLIHDDFTTALGIVLIVVTNNTSPCRVGQASRIASYIPPPAKGEYMKTLQSDENLHNIEAIQIKFIQLYLLHAKDGKGWADLNDMLLVTPDQYIKTHWIAVRDDGAIRFIVYMIYQSIDKTLSIYDADSILTDQIATLLENPLSRIDRRFYI